MFDLYLNLSKLIGQFCGSSLDITRGQLHIRLPKLYFKWSLACKIFLVLSLVISMCGTMTCKIEHHEHLLVIFHMCVCAPACTCVCACVVVKFSEWHCEWMFRSVCNWSVVLPNCDGYERKDDLELEFLQSELWSTLFQSGYQKSLLTKTQSGVLVQLQLLIFLWSQ